MKGGGSSSSSRSGIHKRRRNINTRSSRIHKRRRNINKRRSRHKTREADQEEFTLKSGSSISQEKKKPDDEEQQTVDCLVTERIIRFDELFPPADPMNTDKEQRVDYLFQKPRIRFDRNFPCDIIFEILARTTFETLDVCTRISKEWRDLITDHRFTDVYQKKHNIINLYDEKEWLDFNTDERFIYKNRNKKKFAGYMLQREHDSIFIPLDEKNCHPCVRNWQIPEGKEILASSKQGIVICRDRISENYFVGKPAARKWKMMPKPDYLGGNNESPGPACHGMVVLGLSPLWYKVVKLDWGSNYLYYQIFDSKQRKWQEAEYFCSGVKAMVSHHCPTVCVSESIYWGTIRDEVVAFNGLNDSFSIIYMPEQNYLCDYQIHEFNGRLGLVGGYGGELELWEMVDAIDKTSTWRKRWVGHCKDFKERREHNILYAKVQDEIVHYRKCHYGCCQIFRFGL